MINEKKINKAMSSYAMETWNHVEERFAAMNGFKEGAEWAQQEFIKSLWHDASEEPKGEEEWIVIKFKIGNLVSARQVYEFGENWKGFADKCPPFLWCYLSDILPKKGGEE